MSRKNPDENRIFTGLRLPPKLMTRLDDYCQKQRIPPSRTRVMEIALHEFLDRETSPPSAS